MGGVLSQLVGPLAVGDDLTPPPKVNRFCHPQVVRANVAIFLGGKLISRCMYLTPLDRNGTTVSEQSTPPAKSYGCGRFFQLWAKWATFILMSLSILGVFSAVFRLQTSVLFSNCFQGCCLRINHFCEQTEFPLHVYHTPDQKLTKSSLAFQGQHWLVQ